MSKKILAITLFLFASFGIAFAETDPATSVSTVSDTVSDTTKTSESAPSSSVVNSLKPTSAVIEKTSRTNQVVPKKDVNVGAPTGIVKPGIREGIKPELTEFRNKVAQIKDEKKKIIVEKIIANITTINTNKTNRMTKALDVISSFLSRLKEKSTLLKNSGKDTKNLDAAILEAENLVASAREKVNAQALKTYSANITTDATLRSTIGSMVSAFKLDIQVVHKAVIDAKQAAQKARMELAKITGEGKNSATNSAGIQ